MNKIAKIVLIWAMFTSFIGGYAASHNLEFLVTDHSGMKFIIEYKLPDTEVNHVDLVFYKCSDPSNRVYGHATDFGRGFFYINTDTPLFDFTFPKGEFKDMQPFKNICFLFYEDGEYVLAPKETKDPGWRIPYLLYKREGVIVAPEAAPTENNNKKPSLQSSDFLTSDLKLKPISEISQSLRKMGFAETTDDDSGTKEYTKGDLSITYYFEEMEGGDDCFTLYFTTVADAQEFIAPMTRDKKWKQQINYSGEVIGLKYNRTAIFYNFNDFPDVTICYRR